MSKFKQKIREARYQEDNEYEEKQDDSNKSIEFFEIPNTNAAKLATRYEKNATYSSSRSFPLFDEIDQNETNQKSTQKQLKKFLIKRVFSSESSDEEQLNRNETKSGFGKLNITFYLTCINYGAGLAALWRFPYLLYQNGGGTFIIPYFIFLNLIGAPLLFLELNLAQYTSRGVTKCWKMAPIFKGIGISMVIACILVSIYYSMIIAYSIYYFLLSFRSNLDWNICDHAWASKNCTSNFTNFTINCEGRDLVRGLDGICYQYSDFHGRKNIGWWNAKKRVEFLRPVLSTEEFFNQFILEKSSNMNNGKDVVWQLSLCLLSAWVLIYLYVFKGTKWSGKIVYFTTIFTFIILLIVGIFGWILPGSRLGIEFMFVPNVSRLSDSKVWFDALVQVLLTYGVTLGGILHLSSKNCFKMNTLLTTFILQFINTSVSLFAAFVIFGYVGHLAHVTKQNIDEVVSSGPQFVFVIFSFAVNQIAGSPFWSICVYFMLLTVGLVSQATLVDVIIQAITDTWNKLRNKKFIVAFLVCAALYLLGLPLATEAGIYWFVLYDKFATGWALILIGFFECIALSWVYGILNFQKDIRLMIGKKLTDIKVFWYWIIHWIFITPGLLLAIAIFAWVEFKPLQHVNYELPYWAETLGWLMMAFILSGIVLWIFYDIFNVIFISKIGIMSLFKPETKWGPLKTENKRYATHLSHLSAFHNRN